MGDHAGRPTGTTLLLSIAALALLYFVGGGFGLTLAVEHRAATLIWPPSGLALAALILFGARLWPGVFLGAVAVSVMQGLSPQATLGIAVGNVSSALIGALWLTRSTRFRPSLDRLQDVAELMIVGGAIACTVSAVVGTTTLWLDGQLDGSRYFQVLRIWWQGDLGGVVVLTPILLVSRTGRPAWSDLVTRREFWAIAILLFGACQITFGARASSEIRSIASQLPLFIVVWAAARLGSRGTAVVTLPTLLFAVIATRRGHGPFVTGNPTTDMSLLWFYVVTIGGMAPTLAAAITQYDAAYARSRLDVTESLQIERDRQLLEQRASIMREMHDGVGGQLVSVLSMVQRGRSTPEEIAEALRRILDDMDFIVDSLENSREGMPALLDRLRERLEPLLRRTGIETEWRIDPRSPLESFSPKRSLHSVRIIQEAVTNVIRHARASRIVVAIAPGEGAGSTTIEICDDGVGGEPAVTGHGYGMRNMRDRAGEIGGAIRFEAASPGRRVVLVLPVPTATD
jgi:integral membrane sensor domain MASE1/two-component sensor histidine kinase